MNDHELARKLARETGTLLIGLRNHAASLSGGEDETHSVLAEEVLGSEGDRVAHDYLMDQFSSHRPDDVVLSEEGDLEVARLNAKRVWIIDPLDGTAQYSSGGEDFAVHIALWEADSQAASNISVASVAVPARNELWSMDEQAVTRELDGSPIRILVSRSRPPREIPAVIKKLEEAFPERGRVETIPMGSVGAKVGAILSGTADVYFNSGGFYEWDLAAPLGIAVHNGLSVTDCKGNQIELNKVDLKVKDILICRPELTKTIVMALETK
jgi:3'(2'), 5'-bisphosphate nucleotidase